ncbi:MAG TPA: TolC family protein [Ignavibacteriales bacterium]|nr:TolC family protein [Ignavibacteriales bacterium]
MRKSSLGLVIFFAMFTAANAQQMTLKQAIDYALTNNSNVKVAEYNAKIADMQVNQQLGSGLPQIDGTAYVKDNMDIATTTIGGMSIKMGTRYTTVAGLSLTQKIFDPLFWVGLKAAKLSDQLASQNMRQTDESVAYSVAATYYSAVILKKQLNNYKSSLEASSKNLASAELRYKTGTIRKTEFDKIRVSYNNTKSQLQSAELSYTYSLNSLKFVMGMQAQDSIALVDETITNEADTAAALLLNDDYIPNRIDYQLLQTNLSLMKANKQQYISKMLPSLSVGAYYGYQTMGQEFNAFKPEADWGKSSYMQLTLSVPIFSGFSRLSQVSQAQVNIDITKEKINNIEQAIKTDVSNYTTNYLNALSSLQNEKDNMDLAQSVYNDTQTQYQQGSSSSLDLITAEASYLTAQTTYLKKLLTLYTARLDLEKSKGSLMNFINNLK